MFKVVLAGVAGVAIGAVAGYILSERKWQRKFDAEVETERQELRDCLRNVKNETKITDAINEYTSEDESEEEMEDESDEGKEEVDIVHPNRRGPDDEYTIPYHKMYNQDGTKKTPAEVLRALHPDIPVAEETTEAVPKEIIEVDEDLIHDDAYLEGLKHLDANGKLLEEDSELESYSKIYLDELHVPWDTFDVARDDYDYEYLRYYCKDDVWCTEDGRILTEPEELIGYENRILIEKNVPTIPEYIEQKYCLVVAHCIEQIVHIDATWKESWAEAYHDKTPEEFLETLSPRQRRELSYGTTSNESKE